jgi:hypothetical protein
MCLLQTDDIRIGVADGLHNAVAHPRREPIAAIPLQQAGQGRCSKSLSSTSNRKASSQQMQAEKPAANICTTRLHHQTYPIDVVCQHSYLISIFKLHLVRVATETKLWAYAQGHGIATGPMQVCT